MQFKGFFRFTAIIVFSLFLISNQVFTARASAVDTQAISAEDILDLKIPFRWGIIRDLYNSGTDKLIVNIQDAHCDFVAQENISRILERLASDYRLKVVALEGASGQVQNPILSFFPQDSVKKEVSLYLVKEGKLTGAEYLAITSDYGLKLYGVEDIRLYMDNLEAFQRSQPFKKEAKAYFSLLKRALDKLKPYLYNDGLKEYDQLEENYSKRRISFDEYVVDLFHLMQKHGLSKVEYPTFFELQKAVELEAKVDFKKADVERTSLITELAQVIVDKNDISVLVEKSLNFKKGILSAGAFASYLKDLAFKMKLNMVDYPNFSSYEKYITKYEEVANESLFKELRQIKADLKNVLYTDDDQRQLDVLYRNLEALVKLVDLKMVNEDIEYFFKNRDQINSQGFRAFIEPQAYKHKITINLPAQISKIDAYIPAWAKFYELADMRDMAFVEKTLQYMDKDDADYAALITGGFHTEQLTKILKSKKISYLVITPRASTEGDSAYLNIMQGGRTKLEQFLAQLQSTLGVFVDIDQGVLEESNLSDAQLKDLQTKKQGKLELQVASAATFMAVNMIANSDNTDGVDWGNVRSEVKAAMSTAFENSGMSLEQAEHLGAIVDNVISSLEKQESSGALQISDGVLSVDFGSDNVLVYNPAGAEGAKISVVAKADAAEVIRSSNLTLNAGSSIAVNSALTGDETTSADILLSKMEGSNLAFNDKVKIGVALNEASSVLRSGAENKNEVLASLRVKLEDAGLSEQDINDFIAAIVVADTKLASNPVIVQAAKQVAVSMGLNSKDTELMATLQTGIARVVSSDAGKKQEAVKQLANEINADAETLGSVLDSEMTVAGLSVNPVVVQAAVQVAVSMDIDKDNDEMMSKLQTGIARVMSSPAESKQGALMQLASEINADADTLAAVIDSEITVASLSVNPVIVQAAKRIAVKAGIDVADKDLMSTLQTGIAKVMSAPVETKKEAVTQLANEINVSEDTLGSIIDIEVSTASLSVSSTTVKVAEQLARYLGITDPEVSAQVMPVLQTGIAEVMMSTSQTKAEVIANLADNINDAVQADITNETSLGRLMDVYVGVVNLDSNPITTLVSEQVVQEFGLDSEVMPIVQMGVAEFMSAGTTQAKAKVADKIIAQISDMTGVSVADQDTMVSVIDNKINSANLALNPVTVDAAQNLANELGVTESKMPEVMPALQTGVANIMLSEPSSKSAAIEQLAESISSDLSSSIDTDVLGNVVDSQINIASLAANPAAVMASEQIAEDVGIGQAQKSEMLPMIQTGVAQIMSAQTSEAKSLAMDTLVETLSARPEVNQTKAELMETIDSSIAAASVTVTAESALPAQINTAELSATADNFQGKLLAEAGLTPQVVANVKQNLAQQHKVGVHEGFLLTGQDMPEEIEAPIKDAGLTGNVKVKISASRKGQQLEESDMKVSVLRTEDNSAVVTITFDNFNTNSKKEIGNVRGLMENKETGLLTAEGSELLSVYSEALSPSVSKATQKVERTRYSEKLKEMQSQVKFVAIDATFFATVEGETITEDGIKARLGGLISQECINKVTKGRTTKFMITENESLSVKNESGEQVNVDLYSLIMQLGYSPNDFIVVDANASASVQNAENPQPVTNGIVLAVAEKIAGKGNARVHFLAPENKAAQLAKFQEENSDKVTYTLFSQDIGSNQIRNGDAFIADALKVMIVGSKEMTDGDRKALAGAILATINIDMSQEKVESLLGETFESTSMSKTINLKNDVELFIAAETWA